MNNRKIGTGQVGGRDFRGEGDMIPIYMKIDILAVVIFYEKPVGSTLRAQQIAFFHFGLPLLNNPGYGEQVTRMVRVHLSPKTTRSNKC